MITKLKELTVVFQNTICDSFLEDIQDIGIAHLEYSKTEETSEINTNLDKIHSIQTFFEDNKVDINKYKQSKKPIKELLDEYDSLFSKLEEINDIEKKLKEDLLNTEPFGNLDDEKLSEMKSFGLELRFYHVPRRFIEKISVEHEVFYTYQDGSVLIVVFNNEELNYNEQSLPKKTYKTVQKKFKDLEIEKQEIINKISNLAKYNDYLYEEQANLLNKFHFTEVKSSIKNIEETVNIIKMWVPKKDIKFVVNKLNAYGTVAYSVIDAPVSRETPVLLKNDRFSKMFESITKLFSLPNYEELDLTPFFAPFFTMFFGLCVGDAGYGIGLMILSALMLKKNALIGKLGLVFSFSVLFWGLITGTFFGINVFEHPLPILSKFAVLNTSHMFYFALLVGLFQIFFGMSLKAIYAMLYKGFKYSLVSFGWLFLLFSVVGLYLKDKPFVEGFFIGKAVIEFYQMISPFLMYGVYLGTALILLFNDMSIPIYKRIGKGLWELYGITGFFGDLLSYIRLFALGISSAILGTVINSLGESLLDIPIPGLREIAYFGFLFVGHFANMLLALLGAFVHSLRLTFVEFYKNAGFEGGGKKYLRFKKNRVLKETL